MAADGLPFADPVEQGRLGREVEKILRELTDVARRVGIGDEEDEDGRALHLARLAALQFSHLADRAVDVGRLCRAVEEELMLAEAFVSALSATPLRWALGDEETPILGRSGAWETVLPPVTRKEYVRTMARLVSVIRQWFPGDTAQRWKELARTAAREYSAPRADGGRAPGPMSPFRGGAT